MLMTSQKNYAALLDGRDTFGHDRQRVLEELIFAAENYETVAEKQEMCMIVQMQRDGVEAN